MQLHNRWQAFANEQEAEVVARLPYQDEGEGRIKTAILQALWVLPYCLGPSSCADAACICMCLGLHVVKSYRNVFFTYSRQGSRHYEEQAASALTCIISLLQTLLCSPCVACTWLHFSNYCGYHSASSQKRLYSIGPWMVLCSVWGVAGLLSAMAQL